MKKKIYLSFLSVFITVISFAQDLTGTWEGQMGADQFLQVNIIQRGDKFCGYSYDYLLNNRRNYCKAYFNVIYDKQNKEWVLTGTSFIENPFRFPEGHSLMRIRLGYIEMEGRPMLRGKVGFKSVFASLLSFGTTSPVVLHKMSDRPTFVYPAMMDCLNQPVKSDTVQSVPEPVKRDSVIQKKPDTVVLIMPPVNKDSLGITKEMVTRKSETISTLKVDSRKIQIKVFDNGITDNDTVSVFYNNRLLLSHQQISSKPIIIDLELDSGSRHELTLFAENLGRIPPNTALLIILAGEKRYELRASADLTKNASVILEYTGAK